MWKTQDIEVVLYHLRYSKFWIIVVNNKYLYYFSGGGINCITSIRNTLAFNLYGTCQSQFVFTNTIRNINNNDHYQKQKITIHIFFIIAINLGV